MIKWIDQMLEKIVVLGSELEDLRQTYDIANQGGHVALAELKLVTKNATEAAERAGRAAITSVISAKEVVIATTGPEKRLHLISVEKAEIAAETADKATKKAAELIPAVLQAAAKVAASLEHITAIQASMTSVLIAIRAAEAATEASKLAQAVALLAGSVTVAAHKTTAESGPSGNGNRQFR